MELDYLIKNCKIVIPLQGITEGSIGIKDEKIVAISEKSVAMIAKEIIDAKGNYVFPGVIEPHVHFGMGPQLGCHTLEEDFISETKSASIGGITTIITYIRPSVPFEKIAEDVIALGEKRSCIDFSIHPVISSEEHIKDIPNYIERHGITSFKFLMAYKGEDAKKMGAAEMNDGVLYEALLILNKFKGAVACIHAENIEMIWGTRKPILVEGRSDPLAWAESRPDFTESEYVRRALYLAQLTNCPMYIVHTTCKKALDEAKLVQKTFSKAYVETCPTYLTHTKDDMTDNLLKIAPPVRSKDDIEALWSGIKDGSIQTVGSDHLSMKREAKEGSVWDAKMGISGTATVLPVLLSEGFHKRNVSLEKISEITSYNTAKIFNLFPKKGTIQIGSDADLTIVDVEKEITVTPEILKSSSDFSIYENRNLKGWPILTMVRGNVVMKDGKIVGKSGFGKFLRRDHH